MICFRHYNSLIQRIVFFISFLLVSFVSYSQDSIGLIEFDYDDNTVINFYDKIDGTIIHRLSFTNVSDDIVPYTRNRYEEITWLRPEYGYAFDGNGYVNLFVLRCKSSVDDWVEVYVDKQHFITCWLRKNDIIRFKTWEEYLKGMLIIRMKDPEFKVYSAPSQCSNIVEYNGQNCFRAIAMTDEWIKIIPYINCSNDLKLDDAAFGWVQWKRNRELQISYEPW